MGKTNLRTIKKNDETSHTEKEQNKREKERKGYLDYPARDDERKRQDI